VGAELYIAPFDDGRILSLTDIEDLLADNLELPTTTTTTRTMPCHPETLSSGAAAALAHQLYPQQQPQPSSSSGMHHASPLEQASSSGSYQGASSPSQPWFARFLRPASTSAILMRLLRNLREVYWVPVMRKQVCVHI
jgi:hypothetical protein